VRTPQLSVPLPPAQLAPPAGHIFCPALPPPCQSREVCLRHHKIGCDLLIFKQAETILATEVWTSQPGSITRVTIQSNSVYWIRTSSKVLRR